VLLKEAYSYKHVGEPCSMQLKQDLPTPVLEVLASADVQHVLLVGLVGAVADCQGVLNRCAIPDLYLPEPWHEQLADMLGLADALHAGFLGIPLGRAVSTVTGQWHMLGLQRGALGLSLCMAARRKFGSSSARCRDLPSDLHYALYLTVIEAMLLRRTPVGYFTSFPLLEELVVSAGESRFWP
jgi:hypothetical protein